MNSTSQALLSSNCFRTNRIEKNTVAAANSVPNTNNHGLSRNPVVTYDIARVNPRINKNGCNPVPSRTSASCGCP